LAGNYNEITKNLDIILYEISSDVNYNISSLIFPVAISHLAYAHTFSTSESAKFLSLVDQIKAEAALAQAHAQKASTLLLVDNNYAPGEIRELNNRIADSLESGLKQIEGNVTALADS
jgi:hypothetical protein